MTTNEKAEYYMERMLNQALGVARRYDEAKAKAAAMYKQQLVV